MRMTTAGISQIWKAPKFHSGCFSHSRPNGLQYGPGVQELSSSAYGWFLQRLAACGPVTPLWPNFLVSNGSIIEWLGKRQLLRKLWTGFMSDTGPQTAREHGSTAFLARHYAALGRDIEGGQAGTVTIWPGQVAPDDTFNDYISCHVLKNAGMSHRSESSEVHTHTHIDICIYNVKYVCIYIYMYIYIYIHAYMHTCIHAYMHTCIHAYMHTCIHTYIHTYIHIYIYIHTHTWSTTHAHTHTHMCIHVYIYIYT